MDGDKQMKLKLTNIDESARCSLAELLGFVRKGHLDYTRNVSWWSLNANGMRRHQLN